MQPLQLTRRICECSLELIKNPKCKHRADECKLTARLLVKREESDIYVCLFCLLPSDTIIEKLDIPKDDTQKTVERLPAIEHDTLIEFSNQAMRSLEDPAKNFISKAATDMSLEELSAEIHAASVRFTQLKRIAEAKKIQLGRSELANLKDSHQKSTGLVAVKPAKTSKPKVTKEPVDKEQTKLLAVFHNLSLGSKYPNYTTMSKQELRQAILDS